jgi:hypothetical protein
MTDEQNPNPQEPNWGSVIPNPEIPNPNAPVAKPKTAAAKPVAKPADPDPNAAGDAAQAGNTVRRAANFAPPSKTVKEFFQDWWTTAKLVCTAPGQFYETMPLGGGFAEPTYFLAVGAGGGSLITTLWTHELLGAVAGTAFSMLVTLLLAKGVSTALQKFGGKLEFETTYRVMCFGSAPMVLMSLPWVGTLALVYMAILWYIGLKKLS